MSRDEAEKKAKTLNNWENVNSKILKESIIKALMGEYTVTINASGLFMMDLKSNPGFSDAVLSNIDK